VRCCQSGDLSLNNLAKFGYILDSMEVETKKIVLYSWLPTGTYA